METPTSLFRTAEGSVYETYDEAYQHEEFLKDLKLYIKTLQL